jgi:hypothetical protein
VSFLKSSRSCLFPLFRKNLQHLRTSNRLGCGCCLRRVRNINLPNPLSTFNTIGSFYNVSTTLMDQRPAETPVHICNISSDNFFLVPYYPNSPIPPIYGLLTHPTASQNGTRLLYGLYSPLHAAERLSICHSSMQRNLQYAPDPFQLNVMQVIMTSYDILSIIPLRAKNTWLPGLQHLPKLVPHFTLCFEAPKP